MHRSMRLATTSESEVIWSRARQQSCCEGGRCAHQTTAGVPGIWHPRSSRRRRGVERKQQNFCKHVWDLNSSTGRVITRLGKGINLSAPTISAISPTGDSLRSLEEGWLRWANEDRLGSSLHKLALILRAAIMISDRCCFEGSTFCSGSLGRRHGRSGRGGKP